MVESMEYPTTGKGDSIPLSFGDRIGDRTHVANSAGLSFLVWGWFSRVPEWPEKVVTDALSSQPLVQVEL